MPRFRPYVDATPPAAPAHLTAAERKVFDATAAFCSAATHSAAPMPTRSPPPSSAPAISTPSCASAGRLTRRARVVDVGGRASGA